MASSNTPEDNDELATAVGQYVPDEISLGKAAESAGMSRAGRIKKGTTRKGTQRYRCRNCDSIFNDLTETIFSERKLSLPEMFHIIRGVEEDKTAEIAQGFDRTYKTVLDFVHEVQDALDNDPEFDLTGVCEADEVYLVAGEKGLEQDEPRDRGLKKGKRDLRVRQTAGRDTRPSERWTSSVPRSWRSRRCRRGHRRIR